MFELIIKLANGSVYWNSFFNSLGEAQAWLAVEQTRAYWKAEYTTQIIDHTPPPLTPAQITANLAAALPVDRAAAITESLTDTSPNSKFIRAVLLVALDEINLLREWLESFKAATAAATTLADLKTRVAALNAMPDRNATQLKTAVQTKINAGTAD